MTRNIQNEAVDALNAVFERHGITPISSVHHIGLQIGFYVNKHTKPERVFSRQDAREAWDNFECRRFGRVFFARKGRVCRFIGYRKLPNGRLVMGVYAWDGPTSWNILDITWDGREKMQPVLDTTIAENSFNSCIGEKALNTASMNYTYDPLLE